MKKKAVSALLCATMVAGMLAGCGKGSDSGTPSDTSKGDASNATESASSNLKDDGKVLNIYCWNEEFKSRITAHYPDYKEVDATHGKIGDVDVVWNITPSDDNAYQNNLDAALLNQQDAPADDKIDIFLVEADNALKYVDTDYTAPVKDLGITDADLSKQYQYTKDIATSSNGALKAVSWQATPGLFAYRRSIAKDVLGTDDPDKVQEALSSWDKFNSVAEKAAAKGYKMLSGYDDAYRVFSNNVSKPWVDKNNKIQIDDNIMKWVEQTKTYTDKGYNNKSSLWDTTWAADQGPKGKVFGFFYSTWGINFTLLGNSLATPVKEGGKEEVGNGIYGDYAVCQGPQSYYWGGTWICAAQGTDNANLVKDIMLKMTTDDDIMKDIVVDDDDFVNNSTVMNGLADGSIKVKDDKEYTSKILGGQNPLPMYCAGVETLDLSNLSSYDQGCNEEFQNAMKNYFEGKASKEEALDLFYKAVTEKYPELTY